jgi:hypothetical protein
MDGIAVVLVYPIQQVIAIQDTTAMAEQRRRTGNHAQRETSVLVVNNPNLVLLVFTRTKLLNLIANRVSLDITARIYLLQTIQVTNAQLVTIVLGRQSMIRNFLVLLVNSII